eukprot:675162_1
MWRDNRYFKNQFPNWENVLKSYRQNHEEKEDVSPTTLDDLMWISSLISTKEHGIDHIFNYTLKHIVRLYNKFTLKYLNLQQQLHEKAPSRHAQVDGSIYVGVHGLSVMFLRILVLIDSNKISDQLIEQRTTIENEAKDKRLQNKNTPQPNDDQKDAKINHKNDCLFPCEIYKTSSDLLVKFIHDLCIGMRCKTVQELRRKLLTRIVEYVGFILTPDRSKSLDKVITLTLGKPGILSIAIIVFYITNNMNEYNKYVTQLIQCADAVLQKHNPAYELLYGTIGYVHCIQFIQSFIDNPSAFNSFNSFDVDLLSHPSIIKIMNLTIGAGQSLVEEENITDAPLMWSMYGKKYLSAAHGSVGVIHTMLQMRNEMVQAWSQVLRDSVLWLMSIKYDTGNYPTDYESIANPRCGNLVQWCHGSPSYVSLFAKYYKVCGAPKENENELQDKDKACVDKCVRAMCDGCEHIWQYGLLTKGRSICHGVSGNAYSFLMVYDVLSKYQQDIDARKYLYYAFQFASFMCHPQTSFFMQPDAPDSLFEGVAGECCFAMDLLFNNANPKFPCYDY